MEQFDASCVSLAILAGGMGRRMGGPKAWLRIEGKSILAWLHAKLQWPGPMMVVTSPTSANPPDANLFDQAIVDPVDGLGPLRGILTALENARTQTVVAVPVDMPFVEREHLIWVIGQLAARPQCLGVMCSKSNAGIDQIEPFPSAFRLTAAELVGQRLTGERRSLHSLCELPEFCAASTPGDWPERTWTNLNDPQQLAALSWDKVK